MPNPAALRLLLLLLVVFAGSVISPSASPQGAMAQGTPVPAEPTAAPPVGAVATPVAGGRVFALTGGGGFPESIAFNEATGDFFVGSAIDGTIYRGNVVTGEVGVFLPGQPGRVALGLALDNNGRLFVAGGETGTVAVYDTATRLRVLAVDNGLAPNTYLNGIAIAANGDAFITDSFNPLLYRIPAAAIPASTGTPAPVPTTDLFAVFVDFTTTEFDLVQPGFNGNGIVATSDGRYVLFVQTNTGNLYRVDTSSGETIEVDLGGGNLAGGDGLTLDGQTLYVVQNQQVTVVTLGSDYASGTVGQSFTDASFAAPTSAARFDGCLLVVNSQLDQLQGQPRLPFTVSSVPIPGLSSEGAPGTPVSTARC